jgi:hypothetical protein
MRTNNVIPVLDRKGLRSFGFTTGLIIVVLFGLLIPWLLDRGWPAWPWIVAAPLWLLATVIPDWLRPVYSGWMRFGLLASRVTTPIVLGAAFYLVFSPVALIRRIRGKDILERSMDSTAKSYRVMSKQNSNDSLERPF